MPELPVKFADAPRAHHGGLKHTCNGHIASGLPFGRKDPESCARCWEMVFADAAPREDFALKRRNRAQEEAELSAAIKAHDCAKSRCGLVCTAFDW